jgi:hypothetical protein
MKRMALVILLVLLAAFMVPLLAQAHCDLSDEGGPILPPPVHCGGDPGPPPTGFIGVELPDGSCLYLTDAMPPGPVVLDPAGCPTH